jgi:glycosyltransferase involved in cell wall biosynthesis
MQTNETKLANSSMVEWPRITVVTPSFNQARYLERTIKSVLDQGYPNLEYMIVDGGSTDGSVDIIRKYESQLSWWISEKDKGQAHAINKGLERATGEWVAWQNSDDIYYDQTFIDLASRAKKDPQADFVIGDVRLIDEFDVPFRELRYVKPLYNSLLAEAGVLTNQAAFWRRDLQQKVGFINESYHCSFDYDWFLRLAQRSSRSCHVKKVWGGYRFHLATKTSQQVTVFLNEIQQIRSGREMPTWKRGMYAGFRYSQLLLGGNFMYLLKGISRRIRGKKF